MKRKSNKSNKSRKSRKSNKSLKKLNNETYFKQYLSEYKKELPFRLHTATQHGYMTDDLRKIDNEVIAIKNKLEERLNYEELIIRTYEEEYIQKMSDKLYNTDDKIISAIKYLIDRPYKPSLYEEMLMIHLLSKYIKFQNTEINNQLEKSRYRNIAFDHDIKISALDILIELFIKYFDNDASLDEIVKFVKKNKFTNDELRKIKNYTNKKIKFAEKVLDDAENNLEDMKCMLEHSDPKHSDYDFYYGEYNSAKKYLEKCDELDEQLWKYLGRMD